MSVSNTSPFKSALVINSYANGLGVIRSIAKTGLKLPVYAADHTKFQATFYSRYLSGKFVLPKVFNDQFIPNLIDVGKRISNQHGGRCLLCPVNDEYVLMFAKHWDELEPWFYPMFTTDFDILNPCVDKNLICKLAEKVEVPFPRSASSLKEFVELGLSFPAVIKPLLRRSPAAIQKGVFRIEFADSANEAKGPTRLLEKLDEPYIMQEFIPGGDNELYTAGIASFNGQTIATYSGRKVRQYPPTTGIAAFAETVFEPRVVEYGKRLLEYARYTGISQVEFKKSNDEFYLMEINPRPWLWNSLATQSGKNLVGEFIRCAMEGDSYEVEKETNSQRNGVQWMSVLNDLEHNVICNRNIGFFRWLGCVWTSRCKSYWSWTDPMPGLVATLLKAVFLFRRIVKRLIGWGKHRTD